MFTNIAWSNYLFYLFILLFLYYLVVWITFYSPDLKHRLTIIKRRSAHHFESSSIGSHEPRSYDNHSNNVSNSLEDERTTSNEHPLVVDRLLERVHEVILLAGKRNFPKEELIMALRLIVEEYPSLKNSQFHALINRSIEQESAKPGAIPLEAADIDQLWLEVG